MKNKSLVKDYLKRAEFRLAAIDTLYEKGAWADVVRESQEAVELALKALLRSALIEPPRVHDVSDILIAQRGLFLESVQIHIDRMAKISRSLRRDRELAFYGSEDLTPSEFYHEEDALEARGSARWVIETLAQVLLRGP